MNEPKATDERDSASVRDLADRRRPGRVEYRNQFLIAVLRLATGPRAEQADTIHAPEDKSEEERKLSPRAAAAVIVIISVTLWALIGLGVLWLLR